MKTLYDLRPELAKGGFSWSMRIGDVSGLPLYSIAKTKHTERVYDELPTDAQIRQFIVENIAELMEEMTVLGGWENDGKYYLDVAEIHSKDDISLGGAIQLGNMRKQLAIYDLENNKEIKL
jgi:hypothetical protein|tara:strand:+ start:312 stop:674 length:363 start_codon:yes stop_codon:yes gene_type:complete